MPPQSVFEHRRSLLQQYAKANLEATFPAIRKYYSQLKQFVKPDLRKSGRFCLLCFIEEIDKSQLVIVDTDSLSADQVNEHIKNITCDEESISELVKNLKKIIAIHSCFRA